MMRQIISHTTRYTFEEPVTYALQKVRLRPLDGPTQSVPEWDITVEGGKIEVSYKDHYGNHVDLVSADPGATELAIKAKGVAEVQNTNGVYGKTFTRAPLWHFRGQTDLTRSTNEIAELGALVQAHENGPLAGLHALSAAILERVSYEPGHTGTDTTAAEAMALGKGVCQDHSHIFIAAARASGLPARYISGYLYMTDREQQDASHGWAEAFIEDLGWVGFDVSNGISPDDKYVRIAIGRDAQDATPVTGMRIGAGAASMIVSLQVQQ